MKFLGKGFTNEVIGVAIAVIAEPTLDQLVNKFASGVNLQFGGVQTDDLIKAFVLPMLIKKKKGFIGSAVSTIRILALANIVRGFVGGGLGGITQPSDSW